VASVFLIVRQTFQWTCDAPLWPLLSRSQLPKGAVAAEGFITFAPQNPYIGEDRFRQINGKAIL
jgi:hypothetical protein